MGFEDLPKDIQEWLGSEELTDKLVSLSDRYGLGYKPALIPRLIFNFVSKNVGGDKLAKTLAENLGTNNEKVGQLIKDLKENVLSSIKNSLSNIGVDVSSIELRGDVMKGPQNQAVAALPTIQTQSQVSAILPITTAKPTDERTTLLKPSISETPFILHNHEEELKPQVEAAPIETSPLRPMFYKAPTTSPLVEERVLESRPIAARLELGVETQPTPPAAPKMSRTPAQEVRQVNYSEFRTSLNNPFAGTPKPKENEQKPAQESAAGTDNKNESTKKPSVPDTNVVNLKDLPL